MYSLECCCNCLTEFLIATLLYQKVLSIWHVGILQFDAGSLEMQVSQFLVTVSFSLPCVTRKCLVYSMFAYFSSTRGLSRCRSLDF